MSIRAVVRRHGLNWHLIQDLVDVWSALVAFWDLDGPVIGITTPHLPLPSADTLENLALPSTDRIYDTILKLLG